MHSIQRSLQSYMDKIPAVPIKFQECPLSNTRGFQIYSEHHESRVVKQASTLTLQLSKTKLTMGACNNKVLDTRFTAKVTTGDRRDADTKSTVWMQLVDSAGKKSTLTCLDKTFKGELKCGETHTYNLSSKGLENPDDIAYIIVKRERTPVNDDNWFLDKIVLEDTIKGGKTRVFPVQRWIEVKEDGYEFFENDAFLSHEAKQPEARKRELEFKRKLYELASNIQNGPKGIKTLPQDEMFSELIEKNLDALKKKLMGDGMKYFQYSTGDWENLEEINNIYAIEGSKMGRPDCIKYWKEDRWFGLQRVQGVNAVLITLCKEIPDKLGVEPTDLEPFMEGHTLDEAFNMNRIFFIDLKILSGVSCRPPLKKMVAPIALFYLNDNEELMPIAIQLFQHPSPTNPVFFPSDPQNTWLVAKMFFNMGEAQVHQSCTHLGNTHLLMETFVVAANRQLSPSHPIFRLLAPHFLYLLAINQRGLTELIGKNGWVERVMAVGLKGMFELIAKGFQKWDLKDEGNVEAQLKNRDVLDTKILPYYPYRDGAVPLFNLIKDYVTKVINFFYDTTEKLEADFEVQNWVKELHTPQSEGGCGIQSIPERLTSLEQLVEICTTVISTCSLQHAVANFQQYEQYAYPLNYAAILMKNPPTKKDKISKSELMKYVPQKSFVLDSMAITKILSTGATQSLGNFEMQYLYNPEVVEITEEFRKKLKELSEKNKVQNQKRDFPYDWLNPELVPNSISI